MLKNSPSISIITVTLNAEATIATCLQSISAQSTLPYEHIIIDGASDDATLDIVQKLSPNAHVFSGSDSGIYDAMNKGIAVATGDLIGILNSDDFYAYPDVLKVVSSCFEDPNIMSCYGDLEYVESSGNGLEMRELVKPCQSHKVTRYWKAGMFLPRKFFWGWMPPHPTFFVRKSVYEQYGNYRLDLGSAADYEMMLKLLLKQQITTIYIPKVLVRMRSGGASNRNWSARLAANSMDHRAWEINGMKPYPWTLFCKPLRKLPQWLFLNN